MSVLPRRRRDRRSRAPRPQRRQSTKFIPDADGEFAYTAQQFAQAVAARPAAYQLSRDDVESIVEAVRAYRAALATATRRLTRTQQSVLLKNEARKRAEQVVRAYGRIIRANPDIARPDKVAVRIGERPGRLRARSCPDTPPHLSYVGTYDAGGPDAIRHVLRYKDAFGSGSQARLKGSVRLELFMEWVQPGQPIPATPEQMYGRPWYLRSFTRPQFEVKFPMPPVPMLIVYWGRWADAKGEVSPWSKSVPARVEGWSAVNGQPALEPAMARAALPAAREEPWHEISSDARYFLAEREVRERYMEGAALPALPPSADHANYVHHANHAPRLIEHQRAA